MKPYSTRLFRLSAMAVLGTGLIISGQTAFPAGEDSAIVLAMDGGMMGGGMMGGYGPRSGYNGNQERGSADLYSPAGRLYTQTCARCHALPNPRQHTADQWPAVVARMEQHMQQARQPLAPEDEIREINKFLAQHANGGK